MTEGMNELRPNRLWQVIIIIIITLYTDNVI